MRGEAGERRADWLAPVAFNVMVATVRSTLREAGYARSAERDHPTSKQVN